jgi:hypothetical protein
MSASTSTSDEAGVAPAPAPTPAAAPTPVTVLSTTIPETPEPLVFSQTKAEYNKKVRALNDEGAFSATPVAFSDVGRTGSGDLLR